MFNDRFKENETKLDRLEAEKTIILADYRNLELMVAERKSGQERDIQARLQAEQNNILLTGVVKKYEEMLSKYADEGRVKDRLIAEQSRQIVGFNTEIAGVRDQYTELKTSFTSLENALRQEQNLRLELQKERDEAVTRAQAAEYERDELRQLVPLVKSLQQEVETLRTELATIREGMTNGHAA